MSFANPKWKSRLFHLQENGPLHDVVLICGIAVVMLGTLRGGQEWDGDFALYIMNARNIVFGLPYAQTNYLMNPANPIHPASDPPGLPLTLVPVYCWFGADLQKMKIVCAGTFILFLLVFSRIARRYLPPGLALARRRGNPGCMRTQTGRALRGAAARSFVDSPPPPA